MTKNKKQLKETKRVLKRLHRQGSITAEAFTILNDRNKQAINYTRSCKELEREEPETFIQWICKL